MERSSSARPGWQRGFLGFYALRRMADTPVYVSDLANRIAERTQGAWRPSAGAVYPAVWSLVDEGFARSRKVRGRPLFAITERGRRHLKTLRDRALSWRARLARGGTLMLDLLEPGEVAGHILEDIRTRLGLAEALIAGTQDSLSGPDREYLANQLRSELERALARLEPVPERGRRAPLPALSAGDRP